jgi:hypothetical protein
LLMTNHFHFLSYPICDSVRISRNVTGGFT